MIHKPVVGEINIFGDNHPVMDRTHGFTFVPSVTDYIVARPFIFVFRCNVDSRFLYSYIG